MPYDKRTDKEFAAEMKKLEQDAKEAEAALWPESAKKVRDSIKAQRQFRKEEKASGW